MTVATIEVSSPETLQAAIQEKRNRARDEVDFATQAKARAQAAKAASEAIAAQMRDYGFRGDHVAVVDSLIEPEQADYDASTDEVTAAHDRVRGCDVALTLAALHIELKGNGAAGPFYTGQGNGSA